MTKKKTTETTIITNSKDFASRTTDEIETHVIYDRIHDNMTIYTSDPVQINRLDKIYKRSKEYIDHEKLFAVEYEVDKSLLTFRAKKGKRHLTEEQKEARRAILARNREKQRANN